MFLVTALIIITVKMNGMPGNFKRLFFAGTERQLSHIGNLLRSVTEDTNLSWSAKSDILGNNCFDILVLESSQFPPVGSVETIRKWISTRFTILIFAFERYFLRFIHN